jgi:nucleotide-binding universal stress UspA family protein
MFEKILVAVDMSPLAPKVLESARDIAVKSTATVLVAHIRDVALPVAMAATAGRAGGIGRAGGSLEDEEAANRLVEDAVEMLRAAGVTATGRVENGWGATARELLEMASEFGADMIVVGSHGSHHVAQLVLGSVAYRIVHLAQCPVLVVR